MSLSASCQLIMIIIGAQPPIMFKSMYKKLFGFVGVASIATAVFFSSSVNKNTTDMNLKSVVSVNTANAECQTGSWMFGKCLALSGICVGSTFHRECDIYKK